MMSEWAFAPAVALARAIREKRVGCLELLDHFLDRVDRFNPALNAIIWQERDRARTRARAGDAALARGEVWGPLHGVPMTIKESFDWAGTPTSWGVPALRDNVPAADCNAVERLEAAGVVLFGKTNVPLLLSDWQSFNDIYGTTNNPWDLSRSPGGSSGGSAAALAAGLTGLEFGSDIGASIRNPAHYCGLFGHKPTYGILGTRGATFPGSVTPSDIACIGPLARSADDLDAVVDAVAGADGDDAAGWRLTLPAPGKTELREFRAAVMLTDPNCAQDNALTDQLQTVVDQLARLGVTISDSAFPAIDTGEAHRNYLQLLRAATSARMSRADFEAHRVRAATADPEDMRYHAQVDRAVSQSHLDWNAANEARNRMRRQWAAFFEEWDLLLCPTAASAAFPHDHEGERADRTITVNGRQEPCVDQLFWAGLPINVYLPAAVAPAGLTRDGLPCGLQIVAGHLRDKTAIHFARLMEREIGGFQPPPGYG